MKNIIVIFIAFFASFSFANANNSLNAQAAEAPAFFFPQKVTIPAGTLVMLETSEECNADQLTVGRIIKFKVTTNVIVKRKTVVASGALAIGRIKSIEKGSYNSQGSITIELTSVQAVDGSQLALNGTEALFQSKYKGDAASVQSGLPMTATTMNETRIKID